MSGVKIYGEIDDEPDDDEREDALSFGVLRDAVASNSSTLVELRAHSRGHWYLVPKVRVLLEDAPLLQLLELDLCFIGHPAHDVLLKEPLFRSLHIRSWLMDRLKLWIRRCLLCTFSRCVLMCATWFHWSP